MFPIVLDPAAAKILLIGEGELVLRRLRLLDEAGAGDVDVYSRAPTAALSERAAGRLKGERPSAEVLAGGQIVFLAGLAEEEAISLAAAVRRAGHLVNSEDMKSLCDFHVPSTIRRGDLLITVSTGGKSPGLARRLRRHIEGLFGPEWAGRLNEIASLRNDWRSQGLGVPEIGARTDSYVEEKGWLS